MIMFDVHMMVCVLMISRVVQYYTASTVPTITLLGFASIHGKMTLNSMNSIHCATCHNGSCVESIAGAVQPVPRVAEKVVGQ